MSDEKNGDSALASVLYPVTDCSASHLAVNDGEAEIVAFSGTVSTRESVIFITTDSAICSGQTNDRTNTIQRPSTSTADIIEKIEWTKTPRCSHEPQIDVDQDLAGLTKKSCESHDSLGPKRAAAGQKRSPDRHCDEDLWHRLAVPNQRTKVHSARILDFRDRHRVVRKNSIYSCE